MQAACDLCCVLFSLPALLSCPCCLRPMAMLELTVEAQILANMRAAWCELWRYFCPRANARGSKPALEDASCEGAFNAGRK